MLENTFLAGLTIIENDTEVERIVGTAFQLQHNAEDSRLNPPLKELYLTDDEVNQLVSI
jgi:hypothetical protein